MGSAVGSSEVFYSFQKHDEGSLMAKANGGSAAQLDGWVAVHVGAMLHESRHGICPIDH